MKYIFMTLALSFMTVLQAQQTITGTVSDIDGNGIPYVNILLTGTTTGTTTNEEGMFSLEVPNLTGGLEFSVLG